ncbi:MAG: DNA polymerase III subunit delta [Patescibacteria group bacterium]|nr:DNA polymerase III subunit delta [Patescibacteria group bacterium]
MIILIHGQDTFRSRQKLRELILSFKQKFDTNGLNLISFKESSTTDELFQAAATAPFLAPKKMVIAENISQRVKDWDVIAPLWKRVPDETILVLWEEAEEKSLSKAFAGLPKKDVFFYEYSPLSPAETRRWLVDRCREKKISIRPAVLDLLTEKVGFDLWRLDSELDKLSARAAGKEITKQHIDELVDTRLEDNIFLFCDALAQKNTKLALDLLERLMRSGVNEFELLGKLIWQFRILLKMRSYFDDDPSANSARAAKDLGLHPFVANKNSAIVKNFKSAELTALYRKALELEISLKTGRVEPTLGLEMLVAAI